jgi:hypothetical protein
MGPMRLFMRAVSRNSVRPHALVILALSVLLGGCNPRQANIRPSIEFSNVPPTGEGGPVPLIPIAGRVAGARPEEKIVIFAKAANGIWWIQPQAIQPFTAIKPDSSWATSTHLGTEYAALLVEPGYRPPATTDVLPGQGGKVLAVSIVKGVGQFVPAASKTIQFSGYEWTVVNAISVRNGLPNVYDPANASTDSNGRLHLSITRRSDHWTCSAVILTHSFGYGTYLFSVEDISHLAPAATLTLFIWDDLGAEQNHREMDIEISRWGDPEGQNAQFVMQPYYVPENVARFTAPPGLLTYSFQWEPAKVLFRVDRGADSVSRHTAAASHAFTSGIPSPGSESASMNFCAFGRSKVPLENDAEVVIDKFQYLP